MNTHLLSLGLLAAVSLGLNSCVVSSYESGSSSSSPPHGGSASAVPSSSGATLSSQFAVGEMSASMSAQSDGSAIKVYASLLHDTDQFVKLAKGDYFTATANGVTIEMTEEIATDNKIHYMASFDQGTDATDVVIAFVRPTGKVGAPYSHVRVEPGFKIVTSPSGPVYRGDMLTIAVDTPPVAGSAKLGFEGVCLSEQAPYSEAVDASRIEFDTSKLLMSSAEGCAMTVHVRYESHGQVDSAFRRGIYGTIDEMEGLQQRSFEASLAVR